MFNQKSFFYRTCVYLVMTVFLAVPVLAQYDTPERVNTSTADASDYLAGHAAGEQAAQASIMWFFAGFCLWATGVIIAYLVKPTPSTAMLTGKSAGWVQGYIDGYKNKSASKQANKAWLGFGCSTVAWVAVYVIAFVIISEEDDTWDDGYYYYGY